MNRERFIALIRTEQESLRRFLLALCCGNRDEADDIAQDALVKAYLAIDKHEDQGKDTAWLYRIAYNTFLNHRIQATRYHYEDIEEADSLRGEDAADNTFRFQQLEQAMAQLPETERTTLVLHYFEGYKVEEIAHITNCTDAAVKKRLQRGREELKRRIKL